MVETQNTEFARPDTSEYAEYYETYIGQIGGSEDLLACMEEQIGELQEMLGSLSAGEDSKLHEPYTWTLKQVLGHLIDCERIFGTRFLRIAAGDEQPIPGIDQNLYIQEQDFESPSMQDLLDEFESLRRANILLAKRLPPESLRRMGTASELPVSARANLYILPGHVRYHQKIIRQRLGQ